MVAETGPLEAPNQILLYRSAPSPSARSALGARDMHSPKVRSGDVHCPKPIPGLAVAREGNAKSTIAVDTASGGLQGRRGVRMGRFYHLASSVTTELQRTHALRVCALCY